MNILQAMRGEELFAPAFQPPESWAAWRALLGALFALPNPSPLARKLYEQCTGRAEWPAKPFSEAALVVGRRGGKSRILAAIAVYLATFRDYSKHLAPGETPVVAVIAADRVQARVILRYCAGLLRSAPVLADELDEEIVETLRLKNGVVVEVHTGSLRSPRGRTYIAVLADEIAFWRSDESSNPDREIIAAVRPGLATIPGAMLLMASSPYAKRGILWELHRRYYGKDGARVLIWQAPTQVMNPNLDPAIIEEAFEADHAAASAEYGAQFRNDVEAFISREIVEECTVAGLHERLPEEGIAYSAFVDPSGGSADSFTLAIAHRSGDNGILDVVRERPPPFSPEAVTREYAELLQRYGIREVTGDHYAGEWPRERFKQHGITYLPSDKNKSAIYGELLPLLNSCKVELLDHQRLTTQLCSLERRTSRSGKDSIDHTPGAHDDVANSVAGALVLVTAKPDWCTLWEKLAS